MASGEYKWLQMRISEEKDRRAREQMVLERLPQAFAQLHCSLAECLGSYTASFGLRSAEMDNQPPCIRIVVREESAGQWRERAKIEIVSLPSIPGFQIDSAGVPLLIEVGVLPSDKLYFRDRDKDQYLTVEEMTRRILDRALFPKLSE